MMEPGFGTTLGPRSMRILTYPDRLVNPARPPGRLNDVLYRQEGGWAFPPGSGRSFPSLLQSAGAGMLGIVGKSRIQPAITDFFPGAKTPRSIGSVSICELPWEQTMPALR